MISTPMVPLTLELEEQGGKGDNNPTDAIYFGIGVVRRVKGNIHPNSAIDFGIEEARGKCDIKPNGAIDFAFGVVRRGKGDIKPNGAIDFKIGGTKG